MQQNHYEMTMKKKVPEFIPITIVGLEYRLAEEDYQSIKIGDFVRLKMEPDNKYDENAIAAYMERKKLVMLLKIRHHSFHLILACSMIKWGR